MVGVHCCTDANNAALDLATGAGAAWLVMPCCIRVRGYLEGASIDNLPDDTRYNVMVGLMANEYQGQLIRTIDRRITARPLVVAGGLDSALHMADSQASKNLLEKSEAKTTLKRAAKRSRRMPPAE